MLSGFLDSVPSEKYFIDKYNLTPSPYYSKDIKKLDILNDYDAIYGCDKRAEQFDTVLDYLKTGYFVMVEGMLNYAHWVVLMGFYPNSSSDIDDAQVLVYDPYYDKVRLLIFDEFINMWCDGDHAKNNVIHDFIAIKAKV